MFSKTGQALERSWYRPPRWTLLLLPLEGLFAALTALRRRAFARGWLSRYRAPCTVVVVGNINVGGTGKTPVVIALAKALSAAGRSVGIVSRGYGGAVGAVPQRARAEDDPSVLGDEPVLLAAATGVPVYVCADRVEAVKVLVEEEQPEFILSDDGLQHYALERDFEIVTLDGERRFGNGHLLPVGPLREPPRRLASVDWVLERGSADPFLACPLLPVSFESLRDGSRLPLDTERLAGRVDALAGIGNPAGFFATLRKLGLEVDEHVFPDHHVYTAGDLAPFTGRPLLMTAKDAVKCRPFARANHWVLEAESQLPAGLVEAVLKCAARTAGAQNEGAQEA